MEVLDNCADISRRRLLRTSFVFSALASLGSLPHIASAAPGQDAGAELFVVGDWGYDSDKDAQAGVAQAMRGYAQKQGVKVQGLFMLGDNWYGELAGGVHSSRWQTQFEEMYPADVFDCPAYAILGNHDYQRWPESKVDAELAYSTTKKTRWTMPARWYRFEFPAKNPLMTVIALDSNMPFADGSSSRGRDFTLTLQQQAEQLAWLASELKRPRKTPYLVVIGHHPVYSDGKHGDHPVLIRDWDPLLREHGVHLYMAGHDHDMQHLELEGHPTSFFLSGGGGADLYNLKTDPSKRGPYAQKIYGFSHVSITPKRLTLRHVDSNGAILHAFTKTPEGSIAIL